MTDVVDLNMIDGVEVVPGDLLRAAGILIVWQGKILFLKRNGEGDHGGEWCIPGGKIEGDENAMDAAIRETFEEVGVEVPREALVEWTRAVRDGVDFTTFIASVSEEPELILDTTEHEAFLWASLSETPEPQHPGMAIVLARFSMDELDVAQAMSRGELASPSIYQNVVLFNMRITGTGLSYRVGHDEYVWRDPALYLNDRFLRRCNGLIVIWEHPEATIVDSKEFAERIVGTVFLPYISPTKPDEVWAVVKMYDESAVTQLITHPYSTSPSVTFRRAGATMREIDGNTLLVEGTPALLDHIALCEHGVWDKGGPPDGVESVDIIRADSTTGHLRAEKTRVKHNPVLAVGVSFAAAVMGATKGIR